MENIIITAKNMSELISKSFMECLFKEEEDTSDCVKVEGVTGNFALHL